MPEITITADQERRLSEVRDRINDELVGKYGHVRHQDAIEYLLDQHEAAAGSDAFEIDAADSPSADPDPEAETNESGDVDTTEDAETAEDSAADETAQDSSSILDNMMNLLDTHDDKWGESTSTEERYQVELPDGTSEPARTKDDVRALLFKHYR